MSVKFLTMKNELPIFYASFAISGNNPEPVDAWSDWQDNSVLAFSDIFFVSISDSFDLAEDAVFYLHVEQELMVESTQVFSAAQLTLGEKMASQRVFCPDFEVGIWTESIGAFSVKINCSDPRVEVYLDIEDVNAFHVFVTKN